jgi:hypothetical protein
LKKKTCLFFKNCSIPIRHCKKEPQIETVLIREYPSETIDDLGFAPIGLDEPYRVFMTKDPAGEYGDVNLYRAMRNNLVNFYDPLGFDSLLFRGKNVLC